MRRGRVRDVKWFYKWGDGWHLFLRTYSISSQIITKDDIIIIHWIVTIEPTQASMKPFYGGSEQSKMIIWC